MIQRCLTLLLLFAAPARTATVLSVGDGDTLRVIEGQRRLTVQLACMDAPESDQSPYGRAARQQLLQLTPVGSSGSLRRQAADRDGSSVAEMIRGNRLINLAMVRSGQAFAVRQPHRGCDAPLYRRALAAARQERLGAWNVPCGIQRPWAWRQARFFAPGRSNRSSAVWGRHWCQRIGDFTLAQELHRQGHTCLDSDGNGVACESLR